MKLFTIDVSLLLVFKKNIPNYSATCSPLSIPNSIRTNESNTFGQPYLRFKQRYRSLEETMARLVTEHAIPIGSGTVARTSQIPIAERAARAVIAWMRHHTTVP